MLLGSPLFLSFLQAQEADETLDVYTEHPRLFLRAQLSASCSASASAAVYVEYSSKRWPPVRRIAEVGSPKRSIFKSAGFLRRPPAPSPGRSEVRTCASCGFRLVPNFADRTSIEGSNCKLLVKLMGESEHDTSIFARRGRLLAPVALAGHENRYPTN
jgi:hypothetical protein